MGSFANTLFSILLGWMQAVISMIWSALSGKEETSFLQFIGKYWILIAAILCVAGVVIDFMVYMFRWTPYKVWKSFLQRRRRKREAAGAAAELPDEALWEREEKTEWRRVAVSRETDGIPESAAYDDENADAYAGWRETEASVYEDEGADEFARWRETEPAAYDDENADAYAGWQETEASAYEDEDADEFARWREMEPAAYAEEDSARGSERRRRTGNTVYPDENADEFARWREPKTAAADERPAITTRAGYTVPLDSPYRRPEARGETDAEGQNLTFENNRRRRRIRISGILGDSDENEAFHYFAPRPMMDQKDAYNPPVYPEKWKGSREQDT